MFEQVLEDAGAFQLAMYRLGRGVRVLLGTIGAWRVSRRLADTSIAWEDGEPGGDCRP